MLLTTRQAADELGCAVTTFRRLVQAGLLPDVSYRGNRVMIPLRAVQALNAHMHAPLHRLNTPEVAVLRVNAAQKAPEPDRHWIGFHAGHAAEDVLKSLRGWWRCDAASVAAGGVLPVTVSGYVVAVLTGLGTWRRNNEGRHLFPEARLAGYVTDLVSPRIHITATTDEGRAAAELLLATRLPSESGGPIAYVSTRHPDPIEGS
ncbi:helix-turn-helix domain-containing protein [Streptomyces sp. PmtA]|uniref:helix-turn-helix domain-containing protein n=1 Tax=Streptomyces sp. PmtA TaxID=3074275 RepID=UPI003014259A